MQRRDFIATLGIAAASLTSDEISRLSWDSRINRIAAGNDCLKQFLACSE
jgi:hypothetical protein